MIFINKKTFYFVITLFFAWSFSWLIIEIWSLKKTNDLIIGLHNSSYTKGQVIKLSNPHSIYISGQISYQITQQVSIILVNWNENNVQDGVIYFSSRIANYAAIFQLVDLINTMKYKPKIIVAGECMAPSAYLLLGIEKNRYATPNSIISIENDTNIYNSIYGQRKLRLLKRIEHPQFYPGSIITSMTAKAAQKYKIIDEVGLPAEP